MEIKNKLNDLATTVRKKRKEVSNYTFKLTFQILSEMDDVNFKDSENLYDWKCSVVEEIDDVLQIIDRKNELDVEYLIAIRHLLTDAKEDFREVCKTMKIFNN